MKEKQALSYKPQFRDTTLTMLEDKREPRERRDYFSPIGIESGTGPGKGGSGFIDDMS